MAKTTFIALDDHFESFVNALVKEGRYGSASEVVQAGLRLLEERESRMDALRQALRDGENSGELQAFEKNQFLADMHAKHGNDQNIDQSDEDAKVRAQLMAAEQGGFSERTPAQIREDVKTQLKATGKI